VLICFFLLTISSAVPDPALQFHPRNLLANFLLSAFVVLVIVTLLQFRGFDVGALAGFFRINFFRTLGTGAILLFFAYPLIGFPSGLISGFSVAAQASRASSSSSVDRAPSRSGR
jgi:hypothetical protein